MGLEKDATDVRFRDQGLYGIYESVYKEYTGHAITDIHKTNPNPKPNPKPNRKP